MELRIGDKLRHVDTGKIYYIEGFTRDGRLRLKLDDKKNEGQFTLIYILPKKVGKDYIKVE